MKDNDMASRVLVNGSIFMKPKKSESPIEAARDDAEVRV